MDVSKVAHNNSIFVPELRSTPGISHVSEIAPNKGIYALELRLAPKISRLT